MKLVGLNQAAFVLHSLVAGETKDDITRAFNDDAQMVEMWFLFLKYNRWMIEESHGKWLITPKGSWWVEKLGSSF